MIDYIDSSLAYQGHARGLGMEAIEEINRFAIDSWLPDVTLYLDSAAGSRIVPNCRSQAA